MIKINLGDFIELLHDYLEGITAFDMVRRFIYQPFESEEDFDIEENLSLILPVLLPYFEYEEAFGDVNRHVRLTRLKQVLSHNVHIIERVVFALEFEEIMRLYKKFYNGVIPQDVFEGQMKKLSPADYDSHRIISWAKIHYNSSEIDINKLDCAKS